MEVLLTIILILLAICVGIPCVLFVIGCCDAVLLDLEHRLTPPTRSRQHAIRRHS